MSTDRDLPMQPVVGMQEVVRMFNKEYSKIVGFTINSDYSQNEIYQTCALMNVIVNKFGTENYTLNGYLNDLTYYLLDYTKPCNDVNEYDAYITLVMSGNLPEDEPA